MGVEIFSTVTGDMLPGRMFSQFQRFAIHLIPQRCLSGLLKWRDIHISAGGSLQFVGQGCWSELLVGAVRAVEMERYSNQYQRFASACWLGLLVRAVGQGCWSGLLVGAVGRSGC